jgi:hypothetical protein
MRRMFWAAACILSLALPVFSQKRVEPFAQPAAAAPYQHPVLATRPYQQTWYDALFRQFNPDNLDWGDWLEQRREMFLEQTAANQYFKYGLVITTLLILLAIAVAKSQIDKSRLRWLAAERHEDLLRHDRYSRQAAHEAIRKYNAHMEKCNRVVEREMAGLPSVAASPSPAEGTMSLDRVLEENAQLRRERDCLQAELDGSKVLVNDLSMRINGVAAAGNGSPEAGRAQGDLVKQLNGLREQLYRERERNKQLKGM